MPLVIVSINTGGVAMDVWSVNCPMSFFPAILECILDPTDQFLLVGFEYVRVRNTSWVGSSCVDSHDQLVEM